MTARVPALGPPSGNPPPPLTAFLLCGLLVAGAEEFITQGVLKHTCIGWIAPTLLAFVPFLLLMRGLGRWLDRRLRPARAVLTYGLIAGSAGLLFEWTVMGLGPWRNPHVLHVPFQLGMFSFWASVALVPRLLLDPRPLVAAVRTRCRRFLIGAFSTVCLLTFLAPEPQRFVVAIGSVLAAFLLLNLFHAQYLRALAREKELPSPAPQSPSS